MHQFGVLNRRKAIKKTGSSLTGKFTIKKFEFYLRAVLLENFLFFFLFFKSLRELPKTYQNNLENKHLV